MSQTISPAMPQAMTQRIQEHFSELSKSEKTVANFLLTNPNALLLDSSASLAAKVGVSTMTISRFIRKIGFNHYTEAKNSLKTGIFSTALPDADSVNDRYELYINQWEPEDLDTANLELEISAIRQVHALRKTKNWQDCVALLASSDAVYLTSYQVMRHVAIGLSVQLEYTRPRVHYLDGLDGAYSQLFTDPATKKTFVIIDTYPYSLASKKIAIEASKHQINLIIICDEFCHWAREISENVLSVTTNTGLIFRSKGAISILTNLLTNDVARALGDDAINNMAMVDHAENLFGETRKGKENG